MIYFIESDSAGNICLTMADPQATIVPLVNRVTFNDKTGAPLKDSSGNALSLYNLPLIAPVGIDVTTYNLLVANGISNYTYSATAGVTPKASANAPATT